MMVAQFIISGLCIATGIGLWVFRREPSDIFCSGLVTSAGVLIFYLQFQ